MSGQMSYVMYRKNAVIQRLQRNWQGFNDNTNQQFLENKEKTMKTEWTNEGEQQRNSYLKIQVTLWKLRDIHISTYQIYRIEEKINQTTTFHI